MFSLIITIIAVALVAALALAYTFIYHNSKTKWITDPSKVSVYTAPYFFN